MRSMPNAQLIPKAYTLYDIIKEQFDKNNFYQISNDDIKHDLQLKRQQLRQPSRQNYSDAIIDEERPAVIVPYEREIEGSVASIPRLGSISLRSSRSSTRDLPPLESDSEPPQEDEPERTELTFAVPDKDMNDLGDISHDALKRAYRQLNSIRRQNNQQPLGLPAANLDEMSPYELQSFLIPYVAFVDYKGNPVGPSKDREELEPWLYIVPDVYGHIGNNVIHRQALDDALKNTTNSV